jgi:hypothetical protein
MRIGVNPDSSCGLSDLGRVDGNAARNARGSRGRAVGQRAGRRGKPAAVFRVVPEDEAAHACDDPGMATRRPPSTRIVAGTMKPAP